MIVELVTGLVSKLDRHPGLELVEVVVELVA